MTFTMANNQNMDKDLIKELVDYFNSDYEQEAIPSEDKKGEVIEQEYLDEPTYSEAKCNNQVLIYIVVDKAALARNEKFGEDINEYLKELNNFVNNYDRPGRITVVSSYFCSQLIKKYGTPLYDMIVDSCNDLCRKPFPF